MTGDVFFAGVEPGGLYSSQEIKILICYMLNSVEEPMPLRAVTDILAGHGMANFFEIGAAVDELLRRCQLVEDSEGRLVLTDAGRQTASTLFSLVPYTLQERSVQAALHLMTRIRRERENTVEIKRLERGCQVTCTMKDADRPLLSFSLMVGDDMQAKLIKERFLEDPILLYRSLIAVLTGGAHTEQNGKKIVVEMP